MSSIVADLRFAVRLFFKQPGFSLLIVAVLGLGIGANTAIFALVKDVLLRPLPYPEPERLVRVSGTHRNGTGPLSYPDFLDLRERNRVFSGVALIDRGDPILTGGGEPVKLAGIRTSPAYLSVLGVAPAIGRFFTAEEEDYGNHRVAVISHDLWQERFGGDPEVTGQEVTLWGSYTYVVVGVLSPDFEDADVYYQETPQIWRPLAVRPEHHFRDGRSYDGIIARLAPGVTRSQAQDDLDRIARELEQEYPEESLGLGFVVRDLRQATVGDVKPALLALTVAVALVLLIACSNVANMLLARAAGRRRELAVRAALGASTGQLVRQLLTETLLLAAAAGTCGWLLAVWTAEALGALAADQLPRFQALRIDAGLFAFTAGVSLFTALICGLAPAFQHARSRSLPGLRDSQPGGHVRRRLQGGLAVAEVGLALTLLIGAGLLVRSLWRLLDVDPGFDPHGVVAVETTLDSGLAPELLERVRALPGVEHAGVASMLPLQDNYSCDGFIILARPAPSGQEDCAEFRVITDGTLEALGIRLVRGRLFTPGDREGAAPVALIDRAMAARYWPGEDPIGQRLARSGGRRQEREIVGVVESVRHFGLDREPTPQYFVPRAQYESAVDPTLVVKTAADPAALMPVLKAEIRALDPDAAVSSFTLEDAVRASVAAPSFRVRLIGGFGMIAALLAAVGVYGVMAYSVRQRRRELGVRAALGADRRSLLGRVLADGLGLTALGIAAGLAGGAVLGQLLAGFLFGVSSFDPVTFTAMSAAIAGVALTACYLPAHRASRVDPILALRHE